MKPGASEAYGRGKSFVASGGAGWGATALTCSWLVLVASGCQRLVGYEDSVAKAESTGGNAGASGGGAGFAGVGRDSGTSGDGGSAGTSTAGAAGATGSPRASYNDLGWSPGQLETNITVFTSPNSDSSIPSSGELVDFNTGNPTGVSLTVTGGAFEEGGVTLYTGSPDPGTDAHNVFNGKVTALGSTSYQADPPPQGNMVLTFSGLDPNHTYELVFYGHRNDYGWDKASLVTISGADAFTNRSSETTDNPEPGSGGAIFSGPGDDSTRLPSDNFRGYVARFVGIGAGIDGEVVLTISWAGMPGFEFEGKYGNAVMLAQEPGSP